MTLVFVLRALYVGVTLLRHFVLRRETLSPKHMCFTEAPAPPRLLVVCAADRFV